MPEIYFPYNAELALLSAAEVIRLDCEATTSRVRILLYLIDRLCIEDRGAPAAGGHYVVSEAGLEITEWTPALHSAIHAGHLTLDDRSGPRTRIDVIQIPPTKHAHIDQYLSRRIRDVVNDLNELDLDELVEFALGLPEAQQFYCSGETCPIPLSALAKAVAPEWEHEILAAANLLMAFEDPGQPEPEKDG